MLVAQKSCLRCNTTKAAEEFYRDSTKPDGLRARCKTCDAQFHTERRKRLQLTQEPTVSHKVAFVFWTGSTFLPICSRGHDMGTLHTLSASFACSTRAGPQLVTWVGR